jgi:hypothetical protein
LLNVCVLRKQKHAIFESVMTASGCCLAAFFSVSFSIARM